MRADVRRHTVHLRVGNRPLQPLVQRGHLFDGDLVPTKEFGSAVFVVQILGITAFDTVDESLDIRPSSLDDKMKMIGHQNECKNRHFGLIRLDGYEIHPGPEIVLVPKPKPLFQMFRRDQIIFSHTPQNLSSQK